MNKNVQSHNAVRAVLYCILRFIKCPGTFEIRIAFKNENDNVINKMIEQIIVISKLGNFCNTFLEPIRTGVHIKSGRL